jgi:hypothetical protein
MKGCPVIKSGRKGSRSGKADHANSYLLGERIGTIPA